MNSLNFSDYMAELEFIPTENNVLNSCEKKEISFQTDELTKRQKNPSINYEEWMITCTAAIIKDEDGHTKSVHVSRGYGHNKVFVYKEIEKRIYLENFSGQVAIIDDDNIL